MSLLVWYPLQGDTLNRGTLGAELNPTASGATYEAGILGQSLHTGSLTQTSAQAKKWIGNTVTIAMWVYIRPDGTWTNGAPFFCGSSVMTAPYNRKFTMFCYDGTTDGSARTSLHCSWQHDESNSTYWGPAYKNFFELNKWVHLCIVQDAATETITVYRNGDEYSKTAVSGLASMKISQIQNSVPFCPSVDYQQLCDIRIYDHALSQAEVKELSQALVVHYTFNDIYAESTVNLLPLSQQTQSNTAATIEVTEGLANGATYTLSTYVTRDPACTSTNPRLTLRFFYSDGTDTSVSKYNDGGTSYPKDGVERYYYITATANPAKTLIKVGGWLMDHSSGTGKKMTATRSQLEIKDHPTPYTPTSRLSMIYNETGLVQPTEKQNIALNLDSASGSYSLNCIGNTVIKSSSVGDASMGATASCWINVPTYPSASALVFADYNSKLAFGFWNTQAAIISCGGKSAGTISDLKSVWKTGWNHVVVTKNSSETFSCYLNGTKLTTTSSNNWSQTADYMTIGCRHNGSYSAFLSGYIDDFRLYHTCLSENDIQDLYKTKGYITEQGDIIVNELVEENSSGNMATLNGWRQEGINDSSGTSAGTMQNRLSTEYIPVLPLATYYYAANSGINVRGVHYYDKDLKWISYHGPTKNSFTAKTPDTCAYVRWVIQYTSTSTAIPLSGIATYGATMKPADLAGIELLSTESESSVNNKSQFLCLDLCEEHNMEIFTNGKITCRELIEG